jgi:hypothetical protein
VVDSGAALLLHDWFIALQQGKRQTSVKEFAKMKTLKIACAQMLNFILQQPL